jgi:NAD(P)-dependent dehydrogenase (short-subunit alcohol dehydrogenase family)
VSFRNARLWEGKSAIVTGASSGIGREIAIEAAHAGARLVLVGRDPTRLAGVVDDCREIGAEAYAVTGDVRLPETSAAAVAAAVEHSGQVDVLVPSAGVYQEEALDSPDLAQFDEQIDTNLRAPYALLRTALPFMKPGSAVVLISSHASSVGFPGAVGYCASKGALEQMQKALVLELAPRGVRINAVAPGIILTPLNADALSDDRYHDAVVQKIPAGRIGHPEDVAPAVIFLASDAASYIHGASVLIEGGWTAQ